MFELNEIAERIRTQDNLATQDPIFVVEEARKIIDGDHGDDVMWVDGDFNEVGDELKDLLEALRDGEKDAIDIKEKVDGEAMGSDEITLDGTEYKRHYYEIVWTFVTCCFTSKAAEQFIEEMKHRYPGGLRVYGHSLYRNHEMIAIRDSLKNSKHWWT